jgi:hypothetical protein
MVHSSFTVPADRLNDTLEACVEVITFVRFQIEL